MRRGLSGVLAHRPRHKRLAATVRRSVTTLRGSVKPYDRHAVVLDNLPSTEWPKKLEQTDHRVAHIKAAVKEAAASNASAPSLLVTAASLPDSQHMQGYLEGIDYRISDSFPVLLFPHNVILHVPRSVSWRSVAEALLADTTDDAYDVLVDAPDRQTDVLVQYMSDRHFLVCCHANRDFRCASCGPTAVARFAKCREDESIADSTQKVNIWASSHYGGHRFAGNVIVYPDGDWFGHVNSEEACADLLRHYRDPKPSALPASLDKLWRGRMGLSKEEMLAS